MKNINLIVWDLDGTKYKFHDSIRETADGVLVSLIQRKFEEYNITAISSDEILLLGQQSYLKHGLNWVVFSEKYGFDRYELFSEFNIGMPIETVDSEPSESYKKSIRHTKNMGIDHIIFTHGSRAWARKALGKIGLSEEFNEDKIFDISHTDWILKHTGIQAYERLSTLFPFSAGNAIMVEDTVISLIGAKEIGMATVLIDRNQRMNKKPDYVDFIYSSPEEFLSDLISKIKPTHQSLIDHDFNLKM